MSLGSMPLESKSPVSLDDSPIVLRGQTFKIECWDGTLSIQVCKDVERLDELMRLIKLTPTDVALRSDYVAFQFDYSKEDIMKYFSIVKGRAGNEAPFQTMTSQLNALLMKDCTQWEKFATSRQQVLDKVTALIDEKLKTEKVESYRDINVAISPELYKEITEIKHDLNLGNVFGSKRDVDAGEYGKLVRSIVGNISEFEYIIAQYFEKKTRAYNRVVIFSDKIIVNITYLSA